MGIRALHSLKDRKELHSHKSIQLSTQSYSYCQNKVRRKTDKESNGRNREVKHFKMTNFS